MNDPAFAALEPTLARPFVSPRIMDLEGVEVCFGQITLAGMGVTANPAGLFELMHGYLEAAGVDGVKVDVQSIVGLVASGTGLPDPVRVCPYEVQTPMQYMMQATQQHVEGNDCCLA